MNLRNKVKVVGALTAASVFAFGPFGILAALLVFLNLGAIPAQLGTEGGLDYSAIDLQTQAELVTQNSKVREELWVRGVLRSNARSYQACPFAEFTGSMYSEDNVDNGKLMKAVVKVTQLTGRSGNTINIFSTAGTGGEGGTRGQQRLGTEADIVSGNMQVTLGLQFFTVGYMQDAVDATMWSQEVLSNSKLQEDLGARHADRWNDTCILRLVQATTTAIGARNLVFPDGVANREALRAGNVVDGALIAMLGSRLPTIGAMKMDTVKDDGGSEGELFMFFTTDQALTAFSADPVNRTMLAQGWDRGKTNPIFKGGFLPVEGHGLYRWIQRYHANFNAIGSPLASRAILSVALAGANTGDFITGGGFCVGAGLGGTKDLAARWFHHFDNAPFIMYGGVNNIAAVTNVDRYVKIVNPDGTGSAIYNYRVCNGNKITILARVSGTGSSGASYNHPQGSMIANCNSAGCCFGKSLMFGAQALAAGEGTINGSTASPQMGKLSIDRLDHGNIISVDVEAVAGIAAVTRAGDNAYTGFFVTEHAIDLYGATNPT